MIRPLVTVSPTLLCSSRGKRNYRRGERQVGQLLIIFGAFVIGAFAVDVVDESQRRHRILHALDTTMDQGKILFAVESLTGTPSRMPRLGAARYLAFACTKTLRHHLENPQVYRSVVNALADALADPNPRVREAAEAGLKALRV